MLWSIVNGLNVQATREEKGVGCNVSAKHRGTRSPSLHPKCIFMEEVLVQKRREIHYYIVHPAPVDMILARDE